MKLICLEYLLRGILLGYVMRSTYFFVPRVKETHTFKNYNAVRIFTLVNVAKRNRFVADQYSVSENNL